MTAKDKPTLKGYFNTGDVPTESNFEDLIDSIGPAGALSVAANDASNASKGRADYLCDGTADDVQIQAAIDALPSGRATKAKVILSEGNFTTIATISVPSYTIVETIGKVTHSTTNKVYQIADGANDVEIRGGHLDGGSVAVPIHGVSDIYNIIVEGVHITNALLTAQGMYLRGHNILVIDNHVDTAGAGILIGASEGDAFTAQDIRVIGNFVYNTKDDGIAFDLVNQGIIQGNNIDRNDYSGAAAHSAGIKLYGDCQNISVIGNVIVEAPTNTHGIKTSIDTDDNNPDYCVVKDNLFQAASGATGTVGIYWTGNSDDKPAESLIQGNLVRDFATGVSLYYIDGCRFEGNNLENCTTAVATDTADDTVIKDNKGWVTENAGTASLLNGQTTLAVAHGLAATPTVINIAFREQGTNDYGRWWVSTIGAANFTLNVSGDPGASNLDFAWEAKVR